MLGVFIVIGLVEVTDKSHAHGIRLATVALAVVGALFVGIAASMFDMNTALAASLVGTFAGLLAKFVPRIELVDVAPLYVGAFAGMTSEIVLLGPAWLVVTGVIAGCFWSIARDAWVGIGGKIGTVAFAGVAVTLGIALAVGQRGGVAPMPGYVPAVNLAILIVSDAAALLTNWLAFSRGWGPMLASALPVVILFALSLGVHQIIEVPSEALLTAWLGASFVGMTVLARLTNRWRELALMALIFGFLLVLFKTHLEGMGGGLGAAAAASVIFVIGGRKFVSSIRDPDFRSRRFWRDSGSR